MSRTNRKRTSRQTKVYRNSNGRQIKVGTKVCWKVGKGWTSAVVQGITVINGIAYCTFARAAMRPVTCVFIAKK